MSLGVSIIICTYNGEKRLPKTLDNIVTQISTIAFELIVIDNNSNDGTEVFVKDYLKESNIEWKLVSEPKAGLSHARWRGIEEAKHELVLFCDDDNHLANDYIETGAKLFCENSNLGVLGGAGSPQFESKKPNWFDEFAHTYAVGSLCKEPGIQPKGSWHYGAACFFRKSALMQLKSIGFTSVLSDRKGGDLSSGGDVELCYAVQLLGFDLAFEPALKFDHFIEAHRLHWEYYLKLNRGIATSFPLLESYKIRTFNSRSGFIVNLIKLYIIAIRGLVKIKFTNNTSLQNQVNSVLWRESLRVFRKNVRLAIVSFQRNRKVFKVSE
jgi:glycosyltransferase involved in cell wall biosynthesis